MGIPQRISRGFFIQGSDYTTAEADPKAASKRKSQLAIESQREAGVDDENEIRHAVTVITAAYSQFNSDGLVL